MIVLALIAFLIGFACSFKANLLAFCLIALAFTLATALVCLSIDVGVNPLDGALIAVTVTQAGYAIGIRFRVIVGRRFPSSLRPRNHS